MGYSCRIGDRALRTFWTALDAAVRPGQEFRVGSAEGVVQMSPNLEDSNDSLPSQCNGLVERLNRTIWDLLTRNGANEQAELTGWC